MLLVVHYQDGSFQKNVVKEIHSVCNPLSLRYTFKDGSSETIDMKYIKFFEIEESK